MISDLSRESSASARRLIVLGSTGSIGVNTLAVAEHLQRMALMDLQVVGLAIGRSSQALIEQARRLNVRFVAVAEPAAARQVAAALPEATVFAGEGAACELVETVPATDVAAAIVGAAGIPAVLAAARLGLRIHLANKEALVAAGELVCATARTHGATIIPVDSEHSAIFQCLQGGPGGAEQPRRVKRLVLTASGGPFRDWPQERLRAATPESALRHPTWSMGPKVTVDSASLTNKALEIIEAHWLFGLPGEKIQAIIHPQSVVHSFVEFLDHSILAQLGSPDMRTPIQLALTWPDRPSGCSQPLDWSTLHRLDFHAPDLERFPSLQLAYQVIDAGGTAGAVFSAANEAAVEAFLAHRVAFGPMVDLVRGALDALPPEPVNCFQDILAADRRARAWVAQRLAQL